jgi:hypothetical protein
MVFSNGLFAVYGFSRVVRPAELELHVLVDVCQLFPTMEDSGKEDGEKYHYEVMYLTCCTRKCSADHVHLVSS